MRITEIVIKDYQGIEFLKVAVPAAGGVFEGKNAVGKTSALDAVFAALIARGIKAENVRVGADRSEIMIKLDSGEKVRREIRSGGGTEIGMLPSPEGGATDRLKALLKPGSLDPLAFYLAKETERRQLLLDAMPVKVTAQDIEAWTGAPPPAGMNLELNGFDVLRNIRTRYHEDRRKAKASAKVAAQEAETAAEVSGKAYASIGGAPIEMAAAQELSATARERKAAIDARRGTMGEIATVQKMLGEQMATDQASLDAITEPEGPVPDEQAIRAAYTLITEIDADIETIKAALAAAEEKGKRAHEAYDAARRACAAAGERRDKRAELQARIDRYRTSIAKADADKEKQAVSDEEAAKAVADVEEGVEAIARAQRTAAYGKADADRVAAEERVAAAEREVARLEEVMGKLGEDAPRVLAERGPIRGLDFEAMTLDGVPLATLNGAQQMRFAVDLAKRIGSEVKVHLVDGLEALDADSEAAFFELATAGGWQLIGTKVTNGKELVFHAIGD